MKFVLIRMPRFGSPASPSAGSFGDSFPTKQEAEEEVERKKIQYPDEIWTIKQVDE